MRKNLIQAFALCYLFVLGTFNAASAQCENFTSPSITPDNIEACTGDFVELDAGEGYDTYAWSTGETTQTIYILNNGYYEVTVSGDNGCQGTAVSTATFNPAPYSDIAVTENSGSTDNDNIVCQGDEATLSALVKGGNGTDSYTWSTGETTASIMVSSSGVYALSVTNEDGCYNESSVYITVSSTEDSACPNCEIPTNSSVEMTSTTTAFFDWDDVPGITFYQVKYRLKGTSAWTTIGATNSQRNVSNLQSKKYYQYKMRTKCAEGFWSDYTAITTFYTSQCDVPTGVGSIYLDANRMRVRWDYHPNEIKGKIRYRVAGTSAWTTQNSSNGNNYLYINNLPANATIEYSVRSNCSANDWSEFSPLMTHSLNSPRLAQKATPENIQLYPNPAKDMITVEFETKDGEETSMIITDNLGKHIHSENNTYNQGIQKETIDVANLPNGYYFITIRNNDRVTTKKFMKMK